MPETYALDYYLRELPLIAVLRGIRPDEVLAVGAVLVEAGWVMIEVPLNSPDPFESITRLAGKLGDQALIGAGTVTSPDEVERVAQAGGRLIVSPHADRAVIAAAKRAGLIAIPGALTPTEIYAAIAAGADGVKIFPAELCPPSALKALRAALPAALALLPVGGITPARLKGYVEAGAAGFGVGSCLYKPGKPLGEIAADARRFVAAFRSIHAA